MEAITNHEFLDLYNKGKGSYLLRLELDYQNAIKDSLGSSEYYPYQRDSLKKDQWYQNVAITIISQSLKE